MIQRIQTIYMFLVTIFSVVVPLNFELWTIEKQVFIQSHILYLIIAIVTSALAFVAILYYKNRQHQFFINRINILLNFVLLGTYIYQIIDLEIKNKGLGVFAPALAIFLLSLANRAIKKDENLIKSADRIR